MRNHQISLPGQGPTLSNSKRSRTEIMEIKDEKVQIKVGEGNRAIISENKWFYFLNIM